MQTMPLRGSPVVRYMIAAAAIVIVVFGLKYASEVLAPILFAATLAILFAPVLRWEYWAIVSLSSSFYSYSF